MWRRRKPEPPTLVEGDDIAGYCGFCGAEGHRALYCDALSPATDAPYRVPPRWPLAG